MEFYVATEESDDGSLEVELKLNGKRLILSFDSDGEFVGYRDDV